MGAAVVSGLFTIAASIIVVIIAPAFSHPRDSSGDWGIARVYVRDQNGQVSVTGPVVTLYDGRWNWIGMDRQTQEAGFAEWTDLEPGTYNFEVFGPDVDADALWHQGGGYWGAGQFRVGAGETATVHFCRKTPYVQAVAVRDERGLLAASFTPGTEVRIDLYIMNPSSRQCFVTTDIKIDADKAPPYEFESNDEHEYSIASGEVLLRTYRWRVPSETDVTEHSLAYAVGVFDDVDNPHLRSKLADFSAFIYQFSTK